jgi:hypothetical protein
VEYHLISKVTADNGYNTIKNSEGWEFWECCKMVHEKEEEELDNNTRIKEQ